MLFWHFIRLAASRTFCTAGSRNPMRIAIIAITPKSSKSEKPNRLPRPKNQRRQRNQGGEYTKGLQRRETEIARTNLRASDKIGGNSADVNSIHLNTTLKEIPDRREKSITKLPLLQKKPAICPS